MLHSGWLGSASAAAEQAAGSPVFQRLLGERLASPIATAENELFTRLGRR